jgi:ABC-type multidrug transport system ATPase subunit
VVDLVLGSLGYVPQDDIIHTELPVGATLRYAAMLSLDPPNRWRDPSGAIAKVTS